MTPELKDKIKKVQTLIERGATQGERDAAKAALDRLMKANNLTEQDLKESSTKITMNNFEIKVESEGIAFEINIMDIFCFFNHLVQKPAPGNTKNIKKQKPKRSKKK